MSDQYDVFISYRRQGGADAARLIRERLQTQHNLRVFLDVENLGAGYFDQALLNRIAATPYFLVILSPDCLRRCADERDWMRQEIAQALKTARNIVPVMLPNFAFPPPEDLPDEIRDLRRWQSVDYNHIHFDSTINRILQHLTAKFETVSVAAPPVAVTPQSPPATTAQAAPNLGRIVYKLCDRTAQENDFLWFFNLHRKKQSGRPQVYFIPGAEAECHDSFIERLVETKINEMAEGSTCHKQVAWLDDGEPTDLLKSLFYTFNPFYTDEMSATALHKLELLSRQVFVIIQHNIDAKDWSARTRQQLEWYLSYWDELKANTARPQFLIFLNIIYPDQEPARSQARGWRMFWRAPEFDKERIQSELAEIVSRNQQAGRLCCLLKELTPPKKREVRDWVTAHHYGEQTWRERLAALFPAGIEQLSMYQVQTALQKIQDEFVNQINERGYR